MKAFALLAKCKGLRGGRFDIFGYSAERRLERALPKEYMVMMRNLLPHLNQENLPIAVALASVPEDIRGYGHVKERHYKAAKAKQERLLAEFNQALQAQKAA